MESEIKKLIEEIRPSLKADGGDIEFVGFKNGIVSVKLKGACQGCPMSKMTLEQGVLTYLKEKNPKIKGIKSVD